LADALVDVGKYSSSSAAIHTAIYRNSAPYRELPAARAAAD
jgi:hypothetical protein